ncbi:MAG: WG repeat-containing protein [Rhizobiaceae bacterium]|nr:WG repeat-containing protein [Rhizobiaceae bacterium]
MVLEMASTTICRAWIALVAVLQLQSAAGAQDLAIEPRFDFAGTFHDGAAPVQSGGLWGLINEQGKWLLEPSYDEIGPGGDGRFAFLAGGRWGYLDSTGEVRISPRFDEARPFEEEIAPVKQNGLWGFVGTDGATEVDFRFEDIGSHQGGYVSALDAEGWALFKVAAEKTVFWYETSDGGAVHRPGQEPEFATEFWNAVDDEEDTFRSEPSYSGEIDGEWQHITPERLYSVSDRAVIAASDQGEWLFNLDYFANPGSMWKYKHSSLFYSIRRRGEGLAAVAREKGRWGYLHWSGRVYWDGRFEDASVFSEGFAAVKSGGKWGYIDKSGNFVVEPRYDAAYPFRDGYAVVRIGDKRGFLKRDAFDRIAEFIAPRYEDAFRFSEGLAAVRIGGKWGYVSDPDYRLLVEGNVTQIEPE